MLTWSNKSRAGYPIKIMMIGKDKLIGYYYYCGEWIKTTWHMNGMVAKDSSYQMDLDLIIQK